MTYGTPTFFSSGKARRRSYAKSREVTRFYSSTYGTRFFLPALLRDLAGCSHRGASHNVNKPVLRQTRRERETRFMVKRFGFYIL